MKASRYAGFMSEFTGSAAEKRAWGNRAEGHSKKYHIAEQRRTIYAAAAARDKVCRNQKSKELEATINTAQRSRDDAKATIDEVEQGPLGQRVRQADETWLAEQARLAEHARNDGQ